MDVHPVRYEFDFQELKATDGYNPPKDFLARVLPLDAGGALPRGGKTKERAWYEYPSPFGQDWNLQSRQLQLQLEEERERRSLEAREERRRQLKADMLQQRKEDTELQLEEESQRHDRRLLQHQEETQLQLEELTLRLSLEEIQQQQEFDVHYGNSLADRLRQRLEAVQRRFLDAIQQRLLGEIYMEGHYHEERRLDAMQRQEQDDIYMDEIRANSSNSECWGLDVEEAPTPSSSYSPARDAPEEHQILHVEEHRVRLQMYEYDAANIPRHRLFNCEANIQDLLLESPLEIPYYIYAGRCNINLEGYKLRYADLFPDFHSWSHSWIRPTTYQGDAQYVDFWSKLMEEVEYTNTKDRVLAKAIAIANKGFRKMLYFQIEIAVKDCMMLLEYDEEMEQKCHLYGYIASEIYFQKQKYESVLERILSGHEVLRYELTELGLGDDANEDDALEMRDFVSDNLC
jgi:hypothetical protein